ncbi:AraC family transcriptional regulator [Ruminiclostridium cellulolyticum]|uniref:Transcriptional regulator, AraC family n=1 Tax=Ruminiclostridium cellulolyticum (strain ATCC 35319 / DSM 5812 / JCM 6584 / H10) TaxID=394503 RepID=B8I706_RUMCH|nr:effector binding domain-containing protein [Ruminiclostridium cellulolyticum]ACL76998.1 transcriptional regulator, AraC family [Ruminiclostridium cellulolyticum H10]
MDWLNRMNKAIDYIESNLADKISYNKAAQIACCSTYHFQRMFSSITDVPLSEYIRRRRLTLAAFELQTSDIKVIDVAFKYGYESPEAFSRAFKKLHGVMPTSARDIGISLKAFPKMTFSISIKGDTEMNYRIEQREAFNVFGVYTEISTDQEKAFDQVPLFFKRCDDDGTTDAINNLLGRFDDNYTISALYDYSETTFKYMLCNYLPKDLSIPSRFTTLVVPPSTWAIFDVPECETQSIWKRIFTEWFPTSEFEAIEGIQFEMYYGLAKHKNGFCEIWIPVKKK